VSANAIQLDLDLEERGRRGTARWTSEDNQPPGGYNPTIPPAPVPRECVASVPTQATCPGILPGPFRALPCSPGLPIEMSAEDSPGRPRSLDRVGFGTFEIFLFWNGREQTL
jgi:hypothetical protein